MQAMRTIRISHEEIEVIKKALDIAYNCHLNVVRENVNVLDSGLKAKIISSGNKFSDAMDIFDGERDV